MPYFEVISRGLVILGFGPIKVFGYRICGDGVLEAAAVGVALYHYLDKGLVDHIHLGLAILVLKVHFLAADDAVHLGKILRTVQSRLCLRTGLSAPTARGIDAVDEGLDALLDLVVVEVIGLNERGKVSIK